MKRTFACLALATACSSSSSTPSGDADPVANLDAALADAATADAATTSDAGPLDPTCAPAGSGNPIVDGWYADPDLRVYDGVYWVYPTYSAPFDSQTFLDAFSSTDLVHWTKHSRILDTSTVTWAKRAIWAPSPIKANGRYYLYFGANDIQSDAQVGGIGVGVADRPEGPYVDAIGAPLIGRFANGAQPIDQNVFLDDDGQAYLYYGGWGHCNVVKLGADMKSLGTHADGSTFKEVTPPGYVEGALMFKRAGVYYFMWSEGGWTGPDYRVSYAMADSPLGPFVPLGTILSQDEAIARGSGHNSVVNRPGTDEWYIFYHRRPLGEIDGNHRVLSVDRMTFRKDGTIEPVEMRTGDEFCDGNALGWQPRGGVWTVEDGVYRAQVQNGSAKSLLATQHDVLAYRATIRVGEGGDAGLLFRVSSAGGGLDEFRGYYAGIDASGDRLILGKSNGSTWTELASTTAVIDADVDVPMVVTASGNQLSVTAAGKTLTAVDTEHTIGNVGLRTHATQARFDAVSVSR